jgi:hypothetical protein
VRVNLLKSACELVVQSLNKRDNTAGDLESSAGFDGGLLVVVFPLLRAFDNDNAWVGFKDSEELR